MLIPTLLQINDIPLFLKLQTKVWKALPENKKHFLKLRKARDLKNHMEAPMPVIGIKDRHGQVVAGALLTYPEHQDVVKNLDGYPTIQATNAIIQTLCVDPGMTGHNLSQKILDTAIALAQMSGHPEILAKVAEENTASMSSFLKAGFTVATKGPDPAKSYIACYLRFNSCGAASRPLALSPRIA